MEGPAVRSPWTGGVLDGFRSPSYARRPKEMCDSRAPVHLRERHLLFCWRTTRSSAAWAAHRLRYAPWFSLVRCYAAGTHQSPIRIKACPAIPEGFAGSPWLIRAPENLQCPIVSNCLWPPLPDGSRTEYLVATAKAAPNPSWLTTEAYLSDPSTPRPTVRVTVGHRTVATRSCLLTARGPGPCPIRAMARSQPHAWLTAPARVYSFPIRTPSVHRTPHRRS